MRSTSESLLKDVISNFTDTKHIKGKLAEAVIKAKWEELVGSMIAKNTTKMYISKNNLYLYIESSALRQELHFSKAKIISIVNTEAGFELIDDVIVK
ncbi:MAG: DUF721 domain-containing protein [Bacteroidetes bacterium]|nr:DUF721 domain-containing protein [Bacteroidota bacterium]